MAEATELENGVNAAVTGAGHVSAHRVAEFKRSLELLRQLWLREIEETVKGSALGWIWLVLNPLLMMALYVVVFGVLFGGSFGHVENESPLAFAVGVYIGLSVVGLVNETIGRSTATIQRSTNLVKKVVFPLVLLPTVQVLGSAFKFAVNSLLWLTMAAFVGTVLTWQVLWLPVLLVPVVLIALGLGLMVSALSVYFRDIQQVTSVFTQIIFWSSGVFYSAIKVMEHPQIWAFLKWNPFFLVIENTRAVVLWGLSPNLTQIFITYCFALVFFAAGLFVFQRLKHGFAELV